MVTFRYSCIIFALASSLNASASVIYLSEQDNYLPSPKVSIDTGGTSYVLSGNVNILNAKFPFDKIGNCFTNKEGNLAFIGNNYSLYFDNIQSNALGAAISNLAPGHSLTLSGFTNIAFICTPSATSTGQGALYSIGSILLQNNNHLLFSDNFSTGNGGAIYCPHLLGSKEAIPTVILSGNDLITFSNNTSQGNGGAIYAHKLVLSSGLSTLFKNNHAHHDVNPAGGAIAIASGGTLSLSADFGNIIFEGNTISSQSKIVRNSVDLRGGAHILQLRATEGNHISFYDPLKQFGAVNQELVMNASEGLKAYKGTLRFSGAFFPNQDKTPENLTSVFKQNVRLAAGILALESDAIVQMPSFSQDEDSIVRMDRSTTLKCDGNATITNLHLNLTDANPKQAACVVTNTEEGKINLKGPIILRNSRKDFYEHPDLKQGFVIEALELKAKNLKNITVSEEAYLSTRNQEFHHGYQGKWSIKWDEFANSEASSFASKKASLTWEPTGYLLNPERLGTLVPTSLWDSATNMQAVHTILESSIENSRSSTGAWIAGLANYFEQCNENKECLHRHQSSGGMLGLNIRLFSANLLGIAGGKIYGKSQDAAISQNVFTTQFGTLYTQITDETTLAALCSAKLGYSITTNTLKTDYTFTNSQESEWSSTCWSGEFATGVPIIGGHPRSTCRITPFIKLQGVYVDQSSFQEMGNEARDFGATNLVSIWIPTGIKFERHGYKTANSINLSVAYIPNIFHKQTKSSVTLLSNGISWETQARDFEPQVILIQFSNHYVLFHSIELFGNATCELGYLSQKYNGSVGTKIRF
ncbi:autotransporter domain-containing protein [Chlamydia sp. 17-3921]|uniref:autotransporter domain-containing protein n=1 Tax=Chlamydia sp. 17-3921 TaxID=2675798 RepID=UPI0019196420|nr:autotransporter domain-containing protein [Chlamydia sp. 17-3921]